MDFGSGEIEFGSADLHGAHGRAMMLGETGVNAAMMIPRPDLIDGLGALVGQAYELQASSEFPRAMQEEAPMEVVVCLGSGRCMFPTRNARHRHCPFCKTLPHGYCARENAKELVRQMVVGN